MSTSLTIRLSALLFFVAVSAAPLFAQSTRSEVEIMQESFGSEKREIVAKLMNLDGNEGRFWSLYEMYEVERKQLGNRRIDVVREYATSYPNISDEKILELLKNTNEVKKSYDKLQEKYFQLMRKELGINKAAQFWQLETYFNVLIQASIYSQIPFIGDRIGKK